LQKRRNQGASCDMPHRNETLDCESIRAGAKFICLGFICLVKNKFGIRISQAGDEMRNPAFGAAKNKKEEAV
jgi:hypothetical protein